MTLGAQYILTSVVVSCLMSLPATIKQMLKTLPRTPACLKLHAYWISYVCVGRTAISMMARANLFSVITKSNDDKHLVKWKAWYVWNGKSSDFILTLAAKEWEGLGKEFPNNIKWGNQINEEHWSLLNFCTAIARGMIPFLLFHYPHLFLTSNPSSSCQITGRNINV